ncbi:OLC1v1029337C1 [Oldenlandia corymbosa var. corymbosa]|uniref:OLC1v1029337C1 n=1 Tax=Oldenlandia corymbosa var. corymbosa TaxID=529605 RepID=A0AAV1CEC3_OLDCO|nr:OLC1v1029337C1 [Oldenlandia corymbosa var. corymbosa]
MLKAIGISGLTKKNKKKAIKPFKNYYKEWFNTLKNSLLPQLSRAMVSCSSPTLLATHVDAIHHHFQAYYEELDLAAASIDQVSHLLYPDWRNSLERPFLWLGDLHPYLFTNLLRSFLEDEESEGSSDNGRTAANFPEICRFLDAMPWQVLMAWKSPTNTLMAKVDHIECGLRLMVPSLAARARNAQALFVERVGFDWKKFDGRKEKMEGAIEEALTGEMEELVNVFLDANRLRKSALADILNATNVYQAALFFEALARFLVGFHDQKLLKEFEKCKFPII